MIVLVEIVIINFFINVYTYYDFSVEWHFLLINKLFQEKYIVLYYFHSICKLFETKEVGTYVWKCINMKTNEEIYFLMIVSFNGEFMGFGFYREWTVGPPRIRYYTLSILD